MSSAPFVDRRQYSKIRGEIQEGGWRRRGDGWVNYRGAGGYLSFCPPALAFPTKWGRWRPQAPDEVGAFCWKRAVIPRSLPPCPPPTRRGRKRLRLRRGFGLSAAAGTTLPALRATSPRGEAKTGGFGTRPYILNCVQSMPYGPLPTAARVAGFGSPPMNAVGVAVLGDPRFDDLLCRLNGITFHISRRGGPMCPPVPTLRDGDGSDKTKIGGQPRQGPLWAAARTAVFGTCQWSMGGSPRRRPLHGLIIGTALSSHVRCPPAPLLRGGGEKGCGFAAVLICPRGGDALVNKNWTRKMGKSTLK